MTTRVEVRDLRKKICKSRRISFSDWILQSRRVLKSRRQSFLKLRRLSLLLSRAAPLKPFLMSRRAALVFYYVAPFKLRRADEAFS